MEITINSQGFDDPRKRILAVEATAEAICRQAGLDTAEATMMLLTAAAHLASRHWIGRTEDTLPILAKALGAATVAADDFFKLRSVEEGAPNASR